MNERPSNQLERRIFLCLVVAGIGAMLLTGCGGGKSRSLPNIVLIISDDQGWGDYGFMGHPVIQTPHLDKLASEGVLFTRGYVTAPLCCPSLASIITGLHPHQHKITSNDPHYSGKGHRWTFNQWSEERKQLKKEMIAHIDKVPTIPKMLKDSGYLSLQTGKWWLGNYKRGGFSHGMTQGTGRAGDEGYYIGRETMQPIYDFIDGAGENPFFIWYAPQLPHTPHNPPERLLNKYQGKTNSIHIAQYWATIEWFDETCGDLLKYLDKKGLTDNTMILFVCDNGWIQHPKSKYFLPRSKKSPYEGGIRTPIIVKWPERIIPRRDETTLVSSIDLAPTILEACGLEPTNRMQGVNLLNMEALNNRNAVFGGAYTHDAIDINNPIANLNHAWTIEGRWKLIQPPGRNGEIPKPKLYNVWKDPNEKRNLAKQKPKKVRQMQKLIKKWLPETLPD